jgi:RNA polymerase sigma factor (sigma-70 family)
MGHGNENHTDEELLALYRKSSDVKILGQLYDPYMSMVYGVCLKYLKNREESRDAVMQIFEKLIETLKYHQVEHFKSWLYVTSRNFCLMQLRAAKGRKFEEISPNIMESNGFEHPEVEKELEMNVTKLEKCMEELGNEQKRCVQLFYLQQKCYKEIIQLTGYDDTKVKSYIQNGKRNLKLCIERNG